MTEWISVKDRLPEQRKKVLGLVEYDFCNDHYKGCRIVYFSNLAGWEPLSRPTDKVTHWMPLPELPEEVQP